MTDRERLSQALMLRDRRSYTAYRDLCGCYDMDHFKLHIDHVQADPFAAPSRLRVCVPARLRVDVWLQKAITLAGTCLQEFSGTASNPV